MKDDEEPPTDPTKLYFVRIIETRAAVGLFWSGWHGLQLLIPRHIDQRRCEVAEIEPLAGILFVNGSDFRQQAVAEGYEHRCTLTDGLAQQLFDDDGRVFGLPLTFEPLCRAFDLWEDIAT